MATKRQTKNNTTIYYMLYNYTTACARKSTVTVHAMVYSVVHAALPRTRAKLPLSQSSNSPSMKADSG